MFCLFCSSTDFTRSDPKKQPNQKSMAGLPAAKRTVLQQDVFEKHKTTQKAAATLKQVAPYIYIYIYINTQLYENH